jgi:LmbE family N-acetylglucosaminyl deacetylase
MNASIMVIGAHADDNELHFGGTLFKYMDRGYEVIYLQSTNNMSGQRRFQLPDGTMDGTSSDVEETMAFRKAECVAAAELFKTVPIHLDHPQRHYFSGRKHEVRYGSQRAACIPEDVPSILTAYEDGASVDRLADLILERDPEVIFTHGYGESNIEHYATARLVGNAHRKAVKQGYGGSVFLGSRNFEFLGRMACLWETFVDIEGYVDRRMESVYKHVSQYPPDWTASAEYWKHAAEHKGRVCGVAVAETFTFLHPVEPSPHHGELTRELLRNRATDRPYGWNEGWRIPGHV